MYICLYVEWLTFKQQILVLIRRAGLISLREDGERTGHLEWGGESNVRQYNSHQAHALVVTCMHAHSRAINFAQCQVCIDCPVAHIHEMHSA